jgi:hypothetical protein
MRVRLQVWHMWEAVRYSDIDYYEDRQALDALIATVPPEMQLVLEENDEISIILLVFVVLCMVVKRTTSRYMLD